MNQCSKYSDLAGYMLIKKLLNLLEKLKKMMDNKNYCEGMEYWDLFIKEREYKDIRDYIEKEYSVFNIFSNSVHNRIKNSIKDLDS